MAKDGLETISVFSYESVQNLDELTLFQFDNELSDSLSYMERHRIPSAASWN